MAGGMVIGRLTAQFAFDDAEFREGVSRTQNSYRDLERTQQRAEKAAATVAVAQDKVTKANDAVLKSNGNVRVAEQRLQELRDRGARGSQITAGEERLAEARRRQTRATETAERATRDYDRALERTRRQAEEAANSAGQMGNAFRDELGGMESAGDESGGGAGAGFIGGFAGKLKGLSGKAGPIGAALMATVGVGVVAGKALADAVQEGFELTKDRDFSQQRFGLSDAQMQAAGTAAGGAFGNAWGESVQTNINTAGIGIQSGLIKPDTSAAEMQPLIEKLTMVSDLMGTEVPETARAAGQMIKTGLVKDGVAAMDLLTAAQQHGLNISDDLLETINEYGTQWRKLGIDGPTALGTINQMVQGGARDTDIAADAFKEFSLRVIDVGAPTTIDAYKTLNLNLADTAAAFGKGGDSARAMTDTVIRKLREIEDPVTRNRVGVDLFGTQWEDLGGAINSMDLSNAAAQLGTVDGAAQRAADGMNNGANSVQAAKNQISMAADQMKMKLSEAFAPMAISGGQWVTAHKGEILNFFLSVGEAALNLSIGGAKAAVGLLRAWAQTAGRLTQMSGYIIEAFGAVGGGIGGLIKHIPGMESVGQAMEGAGKLAVGLGKGMEQGSNKANAAADALERNLIPALEKGRGAFASAKDEARKTAEQTAATTAATEQLRGQLVTLPDGKTITVRDNTPETRNNLTQLGLTVTTLPDGRLSVTAQTDAAKAALAEIQKPMSATISITARVNQILDQTGATANAPDIAQMTPAQRKLFGRAGGGQIRGEGGPTDDKILLWGSNREWMIQASSAEMYGQGAMSAVNNGTAVIGYAGGGQIGGPGASAVTAAETARMGGGTVNASIWAAVKAHNPGAVLTSAKTDHDVDGGLHPKGQAIDVDPSAQNLNYLWSIRDQLAMIISAADGGNRNWYNMNGERAEGQAAVAIYGADVVAQHADHIHAGALRDVAAATGSPGRMTGPDTRTPRERNIDTVIAEGRKLGKSPKQIKAAVMTLLAEANGEDPGDAPGSEYDSEGGFQQRPSMGWGPASEDLATDARQFYERLPQDDGSMSEAQMAQSVQRSAFADGSNYQAKAAEADQLISASNARGNGAPASTDTNTPSAATGAVDVRVVNFSDMGTTTGSQGAVSATAPKTATTPKQGEIGRLGALRVQAYATGAIDDHAPGQATMLNSERMWVTRAGEAGTEAFIPINDDPRSRALWVESGRRMGMIHEFGDGGFGGYTVDTRDAMAPKNLYDAAALIAGAGFTTASAITPYAQMFGSGQVTLGDLAPTIDTGANSVPGVAEAIGKRANEAVKPLLEVLKEINRSVLEGRNIRVYVEPDNGPASMVKSGMGISRLQ